MTTPKIHRYYSRPEAFFVNSWIIELANGLVLVDSQFLVSEATPLIQKVRNLGKPPVALLITHPHPDHYNGAVLIQTACPQIEIIATQKTFDGIKSSEGPKRAFWTPIHHADYPPTTAFPTRIAGSGESLSLAGTNFIFQDVGAGECETISTISMPEHGILFSSDLIYNEVHPWLAEGRSTAWLGQLTGALATHSGVQQVYPGHGVATDLVGFHAMLHYINRFQVLLRTLADHTAVAAAMKKEFSDYPLEMLLDYNIPAVAKELGLELAPAKPSK
jgi:glyoxylase-like metal-dependent hydrolase (beta-lactamase superfamily II)